MLKWNGRIISYGMYRPQLPLAFLMERLNDWYRMIDVDWLPKLCAVLLYFVLFCCVFCFFLVGREQHRRYMVDWISEVGEQLDLQVCSFVWFLVCAAFLYRYETPRTNEHYYDKFIGPSLRYQYHVVLTKHTAVHVVFHIGAHTQLYMFCFCFTPRGNACFFCVCLLLKDLAAAFSRDRDGSLSLLLSLSLSLLLLLSCSLSLSCSLLLFVDVVVVGVVMIVIVVVVMIVVVICWRCVVLVVVVMIVIVVQSDGYYPLGGFFPGRTDDADGVQHARLAPLRRLLPQRRRWVVRHQLVLVIYVYFYFCMLRIIRVCITWCVLLVVAD